MRRSGTALAALFRPPGTALVALFLTVASTRAAGLAGPPYVTDDPVPTDYRNWEIYTGFQYENEGGGAVDASAPFAEFNYGAMPNVQVSISLPLAVEDAQAVHSYGYGGTEFGIKTRFVQESRGSPQISFYPSVEIPAAAGARSVTFLPLWLQKSAGPWTVFGGGGLYLAAAPGKRNYTFTGFALERALSPGTTLGVECYHQGADSPHRQGPDSPGDSDTTAANIGVTTQVGSYHAILFSFGRAFHGGDTFSAYASYEFALGSSKSQ